MQETAVQYTVQCNTVQYSTVQCSAAPSSMASIRGRLRLLRWPVHTAALLLVLLLGSHITLASTPPDPLSPQQQQSQQPPQPCDVLAPIGGGGSGGGGGGCASFAGLARLLEPYCEPGSSRLLHLFANRPRERTFVARARGGGDRGNATPPPGVAE